MNDALRATDPLLNATVQASAGTGKTWLLVARLVRLLLEGAEPAGILAVTFTRKAAAEMMQRLNERLAELALAEDSQLDLSLQTLGLSPNPALRERARCLYENVLFASRPPRATTFHAFCQEILQRFPVEAAIPPGFELLDTETELLEAAWQALYAEATVAPNDGLASALEQLFDSCHGLSATRTALHAFITQRIDWWAYTQSAQSPVAYATTAAQRFFAIEPHADPVSDFLSQQRLNDLRDYAELLARHDAKTFQQQARDLEHALQQQLAAPARLQRIAQVLLTSTGEPRKRTISKALLKRLGATACDRLQALHQQICGELLSLRELQARHANYRLNQAWYRAGTRLLEHYQRLKREQRVLDFTDLEWNAFRLLNDSAQAHWVQYKLDARIDHFLIDEFQDTNPTQWRLLLPLLQELAAGDSERSRSVFLVGDAKQSIYRFRRADVRLLETASQWLEKQLHAERFQLVASRRSASAIMESVNRAFSTPPLDQLMPDFAPHSTYHQALWGQVELLPPLTPQETSPQTLSDGLRNPLESPRGVPPASLHDAEAKAVAARICALIEADTPIGSGRQARALRYGDILILLRNRTHADCYERALREAGIPYLGTARGTLLDSLEVRDLEALLNILVTPHKDLALAQVLRSPLFAASDADLITLARTPGAHWMERLLAIGPQAPPMTALARAAHWLPIWQAEVGQLPVHDLLDRIYHQGDVLARFCAAAHATQKARVRANLTRFIELALEVDSGRYPSLPHFVARLQTLRQRAADAPDDAPPDSDTGDRVRLLTVHGAKGLEAPVVFIVDSAGTERERNTWSAIINWPAERERPESFILAGRKAERDSKTATLLAQQQLAEQREDANLLYVALTRAQQLLFVSAAVTADTADTGWYGLLRAAWASGEHQTGCRLSSGEQATLTSPSASISTVKTQEIDARLQQPIALEPTYSRIAPSHSMGHSLGHNVGRNMAGHAPTDIAPTGFNDAQDPDARTRGIAIHRLLQWLTSPPARERAQLLAGLARELHRDPQDPELNAWLAEAEAVIADPELAPLFDSQQYDRAYTEVPLQYQQQATVIDGIIDRLLIGHNRVHIIDYKTHTLTAEGCSQLALQYHDQMRLYATGIRRLWPNHRLQTSLLFTHCRVLIDMNIQI